jgi:hypothetical protein
LTGDEYLASVLQKYAVITGAGSPSIGERQILLPVIQGWAGNYLLSFDYSGSFAKGTGVKGSTDVDFFISLDPQTPLTLKEIYDKLYDYLIGKGYSARKQNVSIGLSHNNLSVDLTPGRKQPGYTNDHSIFRNKAQTWTQTNVLQHINVVMQSGRIDEIKIAKIWRNLNRLDFPSFYLELSVLNALYGKSRNQLASNFLTVLNYLSTDFVDARIVDPANSNNVVSDDLTQSEKQLIASIATISKNKSYWSEIVW